MSPLDRQVLLWINGLAGGWKPLFELALFFCGAVPLTAGSTGSRNFGTNQGGAIYQSTAAIVAFQFGAPAAPATPIQ